MNFPKALLLPAQEGNQDAQAMLADYLKEHGSPDHLAEEAYVGAIHLRHHRIYLPGCGSGYGGGGPGILLRLMTPRGFGGGRLDPLTTP